MIRINLLPQKKRRVEAGGGGEMWVLVAVGLLVVEIALLFVYQSSLEAELQDERNKNNEITAQIENSKDAIKNHETVKKELEALRAREEAIDKLQSARTGPTAVLLETARILTPGRGPSIDPEKYAQIRRDNPPAAYNSTWDTRRLWITTFKEERRLLKITGVARNGEDVSEFAKRMNLSDYFADVRLLPAKQTKEQETGLDVVSFAVEAEVRY